MMYLDIAKQIQEEISRAKQLDLRQPIPDVDWLEKIEEVRERLGYGQDELVHALEQFEASLNAWRSLMERTVSLDDRLERTVASMNRRLR